MLLTATYRDDDFQTISILEHDRSMLAFECNFAVAFYGESLAGKSHLLKQLTNCDCLIDAPRHSVYRNFFHVSKPQIKFSR